MSRYIDANALQRHGQRGGLVHWKDIENAPHIDIVRCKECNAYMTDGYTDGCGFCAYHHSVVRADDFCSYGERKE